MSQAIFGISRPVARKMVDRLTARERQVASMLAMGDSRIDVATELRISPRTVDIHVGHIVEKLGLRNSREVARVWFAALVEVQG